MQISKTLIFSYTLLTWFPCENIEVLYLLKAFFNRQGKNYCLFFSTVIRESWYLLFLNPESLFQGRKKLNENYFSLEEYPEKKGGGLRYLIVRWRILGREKQRYKYTLFSSLLWRVFCDTACDGVSARYGEAMFKCCNEKCWQWIAQTYEHLGRLWQLCSAGGGHRNCEIYPAV